MDAENLRVGVGANEAVGREGETQVGHRGEPLRREVATHVGERVENEGEPLRREVATHVGERVENEGEPLRREVATHGAIHVEPDPTMAGWLVRVTAGDQAAARELVAALEPMVRRIVRARRPRRIAEEDLMQEVFMKVFARLGQYHGDAPFPHWVARIAVTTCVDHGRAWQRRPELRWADLAEWETEFLERVTDDQNGLRPGDGLATRELVEKLLGRLKPEDRRVIVLFEMERRSILEICAETGWSFEFTKMRLFRARRKLCRMVATAGGFDGALWGLSAATVPTWKGKAA